MEAILNTLEILLPLGYAGVFALYLHHFVQRSGGSKGFIGRRTLWTVLALHTLYLLLRGQHLAHFPIASTAEFASLLALSIGLIYAFVELKYEQVHTGIFFIGIAFLFQSGASMLVQNASQWPSQTQQFLYSVHVIFTLFGFTALTVSALYALMYILLANQLKKRQLGVIFKRLPPLATLENMSRLATIAGIVLLGIGLALGHSVALTGGTDINIFEPTVIAADAIWAIYLLGYIVVRVRKLSGLRMGYLSLGGYLILTGSMVAVVSFSGALHASM